MSEPRILPLSDVRPNALHDLLTVEADEWDRVLEWDFGPFREALTWLLTTGRARGGCLCRDGRCAGYLLHLSHGGRVLLVGYVVPDLRESSWAQRLLGHLFSDPAFIPFPPLVEGQFLFPPSAWKGQEEALATRGFVLTPREFLRHPRPWEIPASPVPEGVDLRPVDPGSLDPLAAVMVRSYRDHPDQATSCLYRTESGCRTLLDQVLLRNGCGPWDAACSWTAHVRGKLAGAVVVTEISDRSCFIPQVFVEPPNQGGGIGRALLGRALASVEAHHGRRHAALTVTTANGPARRWYERLGFETVRNLLAFSRCG
ncbi:MAG: GNAT family N-acetyltransferase [Acidobacteria bacterium]|nr:GNAT family N-acetyltransferase [Acidobacteriota bacterium]